MPSGSALNVPFRFAASARLRRSSHPIISSSLQWIVEARCLAVSLAPPRQTMTSQSANGLGSGSVIAAALTDVCFSNRPFGVKRFQTIHLCGVDVSRGLVLLFGIGTWALPLWDPRTRRNNLLDDLAVSVTAGPSGHTNSPHPSSREGHLSTARWSSGFLLSGLILNGFHDAAASRVHRNSVPSTQMRCTDHGQPASQGDDRFFHPAALGDLHRPRLSETFGTHILRVRPIRREYDRLLPGSFTKQNAAYVN